MFTPTTWIEREDGKDVVRGFEGIEKARWKLVSLSLPLSLPILTRSGYAEMSTLFREARDER
jgi:hypothetical protein